MQKEEIMELARALNKFRESYKHFLFSEMKEYFYLSFENNDWVVLKATVGESRHDDQWRVISRNVFESEEAGMLAIAVVKTFAMFNSLVMEDKLSHNPSTK